MATKQGFNYSSLKDTTIRKRVRDQAKEIRGLIEKSAEMMVEIGQRLSEVHESLSNIEFRAWVKAEFGWNHPTAYNYMQAAAKFGDLDCLPQFDLTALIRLARKNIPDGAVIEAIEVAKAGEQVTAKRATTIIQRHVPQPARSDAGQPRKTAETSQGGIDELRHTLDAFAANIEAVATSLPRDDREALADRFLQLALQLRTVTAQPAPAATKPSRRQRSRKPAAA